FGPGSAAAADIDRDRAAGHPGRHAGHLQAARRGVATQASAAADRLRQNAVGLGAFGEDDPVVGHPDLARDSPGSAGPAHTDRGRARRAENDVDRRAAGAASAPDRLREDAPRLVAPGDDAALEVDGDV